MNTPNENGVYEFFQTETIAKLKGGCPYVSIRICNCDDGLFRYGLEVRCARVGFSFAPNIKQRGFNSSNAAKEAAMIELLAGFPKAMENDPQIVHDELRQLKAQIEAKIAQPSLF